MLSIKLYQFHVNWFTNNRLFFEQVATNKKQRLTDIINYRIKVITLDSRQFVGELLSFDKHYNLVISDCEEYRITKKSQLSLKDRAKAQTAGEPTASESSLIQEEKRRLGLIILRGEQVISVTIESPPAKPVTQLKTLKKGTGVIKPAASTGAPASTTMSTIKKPTVTGRVGKPTSGRPGFPGFTGAPRGFNPPPGFKR